MELSGRQPNELDAARYCRLVADNVKTIFPEETRFFCSPPPPVAFDSPCECRDYHGKGRLTEKNNAALPPTDPNAIQAVTPSDIFSWQGPTEALTRSSARIAAEQKWYSCDGPRCRVTSRSLLHFSNAVPAITR